MRYPSSPSRSKVAARAITSPSRSKVAARAITAALLAGALICSPCAALADDAQSLEDLQNAAISAGDAYQSAQDKVDSLNAQIADNQSRIDELEAKLPEQREKASAAMRSQYLMQENTPNFISMLLDCQSLNDLIELTTYLDSIAGTQAQEIQELNQTVSELSQTKDSLQAQKAEAEKDAQAAKEAYDQAQATSEAAQRKALEEAAANEKAYEEKVASGDTSDSTTEAIAQSENSGSSDQGSSDQGSSQSGQGQQQAAPANSGSSSQSAQPQGSGSQNTSSNSSNSSSDSSSKSSKSSSGGSYSYVQASMYGEGDGLMYGTTASGATVTPTSMGVAMKKMRLGTVIEISYKGKTVRAVVNDRGPYAGNRQIDLQPAVAHALGFSGVGTVGYRVVS